MPVPPIWAKDNNPEQWWSINNYEILCTTFRHKVEIFLKGLSQFLPSRKREEDLDNPFTPLRKTTPQLSMLGPASPQKSKTVSFLDTSPLSSITSSTRLENIIGASSKLDNISKCHYPPQKKWNDSDQESNSHLEKYESLREIISAVLRSKGPPNLPDPSWDSEGNEEKGPPKPPPKSSKRPIAPPIKSKTELEAKSYHFDLKLKTDIIPLWDGKENTLTWWIKKVGQLVDTSLDIFKELGKVVPRRFTKSAKTWYFSIPPKD